MRSPPSQPIHASLSHGGTGRGHVEHHPQAREVVARALGLGQAPDAVHHGRHRVHPVDAMALDEREGVGRVEARHHHEVVARSAGRARDVVNGPLWYSGPVTRCTPSSGIRSSVAKPASASHTAGCVATMSFGRPGAAAGRRRLERRGDHRRQRLGGQRRVRLEAGGDGRPARGLRRDRRRRRATEFASSMIARRSAAGSRDEIGCGVAPSFQAAMRRLEEADAVRQPDGDERIARHAERPVDAGPGGSCALPAPPARSSPRRR